MRGDTGSGSSRSTGTADSSPPGGHQASLRVPNPVLWTDGPIAQTKKLQGLAWLTAQLGRVRLRHFQLDLNLRTGRVPRLAGVWVG